MSHAGARLFRVGGPAALRRAETHRAALPPDAPLRVLAVSPFGTLGGSERWLLAMIDAGRHLSFDVALLADGPLRGELERRGVDVAVRATGPRGFDVLRAARWVCTRMVESRPDVVLANGVKAATVVLPAARLVGVPAVWMKHDFSFDRVLARPLGRMAQRVAACSEEVARATGRTDVMVIPPPRADIPPEGRERALRFWSDHGVLLPSRPCAAAIGRLVDYKGVDDAIAALAAAPGWSLVVVGSDDPAAPGESTRLAHVARSLHVADRVRFAGPVADAGRHLAAFDAVLQLTKAGARGFGKEGFGLTVLEALLAGVPVVATDGIPALRLAGDAGITVPAGDPAAVAGALEGLATDPATRAAAAGAAERLREQHPDAATGAALLTALLEDAAGLAHRATSSDPKPTFSVIIPTLGRPGTLVQALSSVLACDPPPEELIVVDGDDRGSARTTLEAAAGDRDLPAVRYVKSERGLTRQRNRGVSEAACDVIVFVDDDARVPPDVFSVLAGVYADRSVVGATGRVVEPGGSRIGGKESWVRRWLPGGGTEGGFTRFGYPHRLVDVGRARDVQLMQGCFLTARRTAAAALGFDENLRGYGLAEDEDFAYRLSRLGRIRYVPDIVIHHDNIGFSTRDRRAFGRAVMVNRTYLFRKNFPQTALARAQFALLVVVLVGHRVLNRDWAGARGLLEGAVEAWTHAG